MLGAPSAKLLQALAKPQLIDSDIQDYLDRLDEEEAAPGSARASTLSTAPIRAPRAPARDGGMILTSRVQEIIVSEERCTPRQCSVAAGCRVVLRVQGGPPQPFAIGRDVEDAVVTPAIPAGTSYEWTPPEPGRYFIRSEVYPGLRSEIRVLRSSETAEGAGGASNLASSAFSRSRFGGSMSAVDEFVPFPALKAAGTGSYSRATQTSSGSFGRPAPAFNPGPVLSRFQADSLGPDEEDSDDEGGGFVAPPGAGLRHRGRAAGAAGAASQQQQQQQQQPVSRHEALPQLGRPAAPAGLDGFSVVSAGSGGSPRSGSGSERSTGSAPLYVERRRVPGMLQPTYSAVHSGRSSYSDSRSGAGSEERQPLLYSVGGQAARYGPGGLRAYPAAGAPPRIGAEEARTQKCPRCRKEYLSTINQRRCIASHLGASGGAKTARGVADPKQLAEFWDGLSEAERRSVMEVKEEHNGERTLRELSCQILHRMRAGATDGLTKDQRRLHLAGKMLHDFVTGALPPGGSQLVSVLSQVSEGTFLFERNAINRDEVLSGNNLEAGLGALVTKRLVGAHLAAKQAAAAAMQAQLEREQEDLEAQQAAKKGKQQQAGQQAGPAGAPKKQAKGSKAKAKPAAAPAAKPASKPAAASEAAAAATAAEPASAEAEAEQAAPAGRPPQLQLPANGMAAAQQPAADDEPLSPPSASGARYGASPLRPSGGASQYTNFLFAEEAAESAAEADEAGWRTAGSGRPSSRTSQQAAGKVSGSSSGSQAATGSKAAGRSGATGAAAAAAAPARPSSRAAERQAANGTASAPAAAPKAAAATNGKLAPLARGGAAAGAPSAAAAAAPAGKPQQQKQQQQPSRDESFPALPAAAGSKPRPAAAAAAAPVAAPPGFSYAAAASKLRKDGDKPQAEQRPTQQQQQQQPANATQLESWPVPGPMPGKGAKPPAPAPAAAPAAAAQPPVAAQPAAAATSVVPAAQQQPAAEPAAAPNQPEPSSAAAAPPTSVPAASPGAAPQPAAEAQPAAAAEAPAAAESRPAAAAAAEVPAEAAEGAAGPEHAAAAAAEAQRCTSVTPPISDAGSPPPGALPMPPGFAAPPSWVGPDGVPLMPPPLPPGYYWAALPAMPGMQFGNVDMAEVLPAGPWPYPPFYPPGAPPPPFPLPPPGSMLPPGVHLPPHTLPYGEEGMLAPFPPGMPVPLPPEVAEQLAAAAAAAHLEAAAGEAEAAPDAAAPAAAAASELEAATDAAGSGPAAPQPAAEAAATASQPATPRKGFLALLQDAFGPAGGAQQAAAAGRSHRSRGFDPAAAAAELERRWQAAAPAAVPAQRPQQAAAAEAAPAAPRSASKARPPSRGSSSGSLGSSKGGKPAAPGSSSGRASPGGPGKPVVVAVRAWSSDDSASDGPKWKIQAATQAQQAQQGATQQQQQQQQQ